MAVSVSESCDSAVIAAARSRRSDPTERRAENSSSCTMLQKVQRLEKCTDKKLTAKKSTCLGTISGKRSDCVYLVTNSEQAFAMTESTHGRGPYA